MKFCWATREQNEMKRSRYSEEQVIGILREGDSGTPVKTVCAKHNISEATYYAWKRKYGGMDVSEARRRGPWKKKTVGLNGW